MTFVKICGICRDEDAQEALRLGASGLGFNFVPTSPRYIDAKRAGTIFTPANIWRVGVFVNCKEAEVRQTAEHARLTALQFHGDETPEELKKYSGFIRIKAVRVRDLASLDRVEDYSDSADYILFDTFTPTVYGGSGLTIQTELLEEAKHRNLLNRAFIAGGITPKNVEQIITHFAPFGVDTASGVESSPGIKDHQLLRDFFSEIALCSTA
jgi:phosphoribosylanthranilate isomerase